MLTPGLIKCPRCGKRLRWKADSGGYTARDIAWLSLYILGIAMIPIGIIVLVSLLCIYLGK